MGLLPSTASLLEVIWTAIALVGIGVEGYAFYDALLDRIALARANLDGPMLMVTTISLRTTVVGFGIQLTFAVLGVVAMTVPDPPPTEFGRLASWLLVGAASAIVGASVLNQLDRRRLRRRFGYPDRHRRHPS